MRLSRRTAALLVAAGLLVVAWLIGAHWVDVGDSTCGGVYRPDLWWTDGRCRGRMVLRVGVVGVLLVAAAVLVGLAVRNGAGRR